jgi:O-antigen ligase
MTPIRVGICSLVAFSVLAHGAVETWSAVTLEIGAASLFLLWGVLTLRARRVEIRWNWLYLPLLTLGGFALLQRLAGLSVNPYATKIELLKAGAYVLLFFLTIESFQTLDDWKSFVWFLVTLGAFVSLLAIVQYFTFNGKLYWFRMLPQGVVPFGPFVNHNHFAGFVELISPLGLAMLLTGAVRRDKLPLLILLSVLPIGALALSASRGGIISLLFEFVLLTFLVRRKGEGRRQLLMAGGLALVAGFLAIWLGLGRTVERFEHSTHGDLSRDRRVSIYRDTWQIVRDHPWTGTGLGTFQTVFPRYESYYDGFVVDHAHNDYLELLADTGLIGGLCMMGFVALLAWRGLSKLRGANSPVCRSLYSGAVVACAGLLLHSLVDFNLHIPSNALLFLLLAAMATCGIAQARQSFPQGSLSSRDFLLDPNVTGQ